MSIFAEEIEKLAGVPPRPPLDGRKIIGIHEYDGSTTLSWMPRNPEAGQPEFL